MKKISTLTGAIIFVIFATIVFSAIFIWQYYTIELQMPSPIVQPNLNLKNPKSPTVDLSTNVLVKDNWQTYTNSEYGFEMKYPKDSFTVTNPDSYNNSAKFRVMTSENFANAGSVTIEADSKKSLNECKASSTNDKKININGIDFDQESFFDAAMGGQRGIDINYYTFKDSTCFIIRGVVGWHSVQFAHDATDGLKATQKEIDDEDKSIQERKDFVINVISTFKFTK